MPMSINNNKTLQYQLSYYSDSFLHCLQEADGILESSLFMIPHTMI